MDISVVVPLFNEEESLPELYAWIERVMQANGFSFEVIFVNDGSTDRSWEVIEKLKSQSEHVRGIKFRRNYGKSPALYCGFAEAQGDVVITMDADLQDSPDEIPELYRMITEDGYDLVSGWKQKRYDPLSKTLPTKLFNATARKVSGIKNLHDFNCGLKAYRREVVKHIEVYGEMHRYIPYLAKNAGFKKIGEKVVHHQARKYGTTKFGLNRFVNGYLDLLSLWFLSKFGIKPMHFFGLLGSLMFLIGMISVIIVGSSKLYAMYNNLPYRLVTDSPYFYLSLTAMIIGTQLFLAGFLGELISRNAQNAGFKKIGEKVVHHQARKYGTTKFGLNRFVNGYLDLLSLWFLSKFGIKPMHFFGLLGSLMFLIGMISVIIVGSSKLYAMYNNLPYRLVTDSPYFYLSLTAMIIGTQLFLAGFLGELISRNAPERNNYQIEKKI